MRLYTTTRAPNPRRVDIFLAEKSVEIPREEIDINALQHKAEAFGRLNPVQRVPVLELDDGTCLSESIAICRYFEETVPEPPLFGVDPLDRALVEMWQRRIEFGLLLSVAQAFRHLHPAMAKMEVPQVADWGEANKARANEELRLLDRELGQRSYVAGDRFTVADITAVVAVDFLKPARIPLPEECGNIRRWRDELSSRPSLAA